MIINFSQFSDPIERKAPISRLPPRRYLIIGKRLSATYYLFSSKRKPVYSPPTFYCNRQILMHQIGYSCACAQGRLPTGISTPLATNWQPMSHRMLCSLVIAAPFINKVVALQMQVETDRPFKHVHFSNRVQAIKKLSNLLV